MKVAACFLACWFFHRHVLHVTGVENYLRLQQQEAGTVELLSFSLTYLDIALFPRFMQVGDWRLLEDFLFS